MLEFFIHSRYRSLDGYKVKVLVTLSCLTLCDFMDCSSPGSSVHGILQARILEWVAFSRGSSPHRNQTWVTHIAGRLLTNWAISEAWFSTCFTKINFPSLWPAFHFLLLLFEDQKFLIFMKSVYWLFPFIVSEYCIIFKKL